MRATLGVIAAAWTVAACSGGGEEAEPFEAVRFQEAITAYSRDCRSCHIANGPGHKTGPHLYQVIGREAGNVDGFDYSAALLESDIVWTRDTLDAFLVNPMEYLPGTKMGVAGIDDPDQRARIIYYLQHAHREP